MPAATLDRLIAETRRHIAEMPVLTFDRPTLVKGHLGSAAPSIGAGYRVLFKRYFSREEADVRDTAPPRVDYILSGKLIVEFPEVRRRSASGEH